MRSLLLWTLLLSICLPALADVEQDKIRAIEIARKSVVSIRTYRQGQDEPGIGSGVILRSDGYIITNHHVIHNAKVVKVTLPGGKSYTAKIWKAAPEQDLALLKVEATNLTVCRVGNSDKVKIGQTAIAIGDPLGFSGTVTVGTVGGRGRNVKVAGVNYRNLIQTDAAINPGSSGGALINLQGEVIGINALVYTGPQSYKHAQGLGFAIPINDAIQLAKKLVQSAPNSPAGKAWLGITGENLTEDHQLSYGVPVKKGVVVTSVINGSPASAAGMQVGDTIVGADGRTITTVAQFMGFLNDKKAGDTIELSYWRGAKKARVTLTLDTQSQ
ncbi:MAG: trypsin-like peptidase domain-containing protein [Candidatus Eremiobacterota bacterium]